jgi:hypothetical protein
MNIYLKMRAHLRRMRPHFVLYIIALRKNPASEKNRGDVFIIFAKLLKFYGKRCKDKKKIK